MEVLYKRVFEKTITLFYQDYNEIPTKKVEDGDPFDGTGEVSELLQIQTATEKYPYFKILSQSDDHEDFQKNYGNPLCGVHVNRLTLVVEKNEDKISLKLFFYYKHRKRGEVFFKKQTKMSFITYSFKTDDLYTGSIVNAFKKRKNIKRIRKNYFGSKPFEMMILTYKNNIPTYIKEKSNLDNHNLIICTAIEIFIQDVTNKIDLTNQYDVRLYHHYLKKRSIKYPNNFVTFMNLIPLPSKRVLKKSKYKLVDAVMEQNKLKGDKIRKIFHKVNTINLDFYKNVEKFFGDNFLRHVDEETLTKIITYRNGHTFPPIFDRFSIKERHNLFEIFKLTLTNEIHYWSFIDHLNFYVEISKFESLKWKSNNISSFNKEHSDWTDKYQHYTHGLFTRYYNEQFKIEINKVLEIGQEKFYPVLLCDSTEYNNESAIQSNCVKTYIDRAGSFIISLRKDSPTSEERATIEFRIGVGWSDKLLLRRRQTLGRFNRDLDKSWERVLIMLDKRVNELTQYFDLPKVKVEFGGGVVESDSQFDEKRNHVDWVSPFVTKVKPFGENLLFDNNIFLEL